MRAPFIVAEISANHGNDIDVVKKSIVKAKEIGCDAVKIQTYRPDTITIDCNNQYFQINTGTIWDGTTLFDLYSKAYMPWEWHEELFEFSREKGITLFSTPFDFSAVDLLEKCENPIYKIASFEITDIPLIEYAASTGKPMVISTGIATEEEISEAVDACKRQGNDDVCLLKCTSEYPAKEKDANLNTMIDMKEKYNCKIGLSDHTEGFYVPMIATALGATMIEKHFVIDKTMDSPDASFSMEPDEFAEMIRNVRRTCHILGDVKYETSLKSEGSRKYARSLFVIKDVKKGDAVSDENVRSIRPSNGLSPKYLPDVYGKRFVKDVKRGTPLEFLLIE